MNQIILVEENFKLWNDLAKVYVIVKKDNCVYWTDGNIYITKEKYQKLKRNR